MSTCDGPSFTPGPDIHTLCELFIHAHGLRDHLERVFDQSERLCHAVSEVTEQTLRGQHPPLAPVLELAETQHRRQTQAELLLRRVQDQAQALAVQHGSAPSAGICAPSEDLQPLMGLIDGLSLLLPLRATPSASSSVQALQAAVERLLHAALNQQDLSLHRGFVEAELRRLEPLGEGTETGRAALAEALAGLRSAR